jgi:hypothetical protein
MCNCILSTTGLRRYPLGCMHEKDRYKMFGHLKILFNGAYYTAKNKPFSDYESLLELNDKLQVEVREAE